MTEDSSLQDDDLYLVRVKAQVMTRDDSTGGWLPMEGGGLSHVGLKKLLLANSTGSESDTRSEYLIFGQRLADHSVVLDCILQKDIQYTQVNPTFHHWRTDDKRYGLTFERSADAKAFDRGIKRAVADLVEGSPESSTNPDVGDDDVFMTLDLPLGRKGSSQSASTTSTTTSSPTPQSPVSGLPMQTDFCSQFTHPHANHHHLHRVHYLSKTPSSHQSVATTSPDKNSPSKREITDMGREEVWVKADHPPPHIQKSQQALLDSCIDPGNVEITNSYVTFEKNKPSVPHDYSYPNLESLPKPPTKRDSISSVKKHTFHTSQPQLPTKGKKTKDKRGRNQSGRLLSRPARCQHCLDWYSPEENCRGACKYAPDTVSNCIEKGTCLCCAQGILYHCMADADGDYGKLCVCDTSDNSNCKKWTALTILSLFVPCLWCYWPLTACHSCAVACGCCGSRHKPAA